MLASPGDGGGLLMLGVSLSLLLRTLIGMLRFLNLSKAILYELFRTILWLASSPLGRLSDPEGEARGCPTCPLRSFEVCVGRPLGVVYPSCPRYSSGICGNHCSSFSIFRTTLLILDPAGQLWIVVASGTSNPNKVAPIKPFSWGSKAGR